MDVFVGQQSSIQNECCQNQQTTGSIWQTTNVYTTQSKVPTVSSDIYYTGCITSGTFIAHPKECNKFIRCARDKETDEIAELEEQCPVGLLFNSDIKVCDW